MRSFLWRKLHLIIPCLILLGTHRGFTQEAVIEAVIKGIVIDASTQKKLPGVSVLAKGSMAGTTTDEEGHFQLSISQKSTLTLVISALGYQTQEVDAANAKLSLSVALQEKVVMGQEVVVSASRIEENILQSPVAIEKIDALDIQDSPALNFYDALNYLKGVDMSTQSLTFKSFNTRGFFANGNLRMVQLVDGMDTQSTGLNFSVGNAAGISELDVENMELLPGASSALYGPNAINGILLIRSKSPFQYQGISAQAKTGLMNLGKPGIAPSLYQEYALRYAEAFREKFAFKTNISYLRGTDWYATDYRDKSVNGAIENISPSNNSDYNGVHIYGDEVRANMQNVGQAMVTAGTLSAADFAKLPNQFVSRTGYQDRYLVDNLSYNLKLNGALHYRISKTLESSLMGNYSTGNAVYVGADRYSLKDYQSGQVKAELKGAHFFVRAYTTQEGSGRSYAPGTLAQQINESWKSNTIWFGQYVAAYASATNFGQSAGEAHTTARNFADLGRVEPGSPEFNATKQRISRTYAPAGPRFRNKTNLYHAEGLYRITQLPAIAEITVGGNYRQYDLRSQGTVYTLKPDGREYNIHELGGYIQAVRQFWREHLKVTASLRYDRNLNFRGQFTPRISAVYTFWENHHIRLSYQSGFRIPNTQDQYGDVLVQGGRLIGGLPLFREKYNLDVNPVYTLQSVQQFGRTGNREDLAVYPFRKFEPERVQSLEAGYKTLVNNKLFVDAYFYLNRYTNFTAQQTAVQFTPTPANPLAVAVYIFPVSSLGYTSSFGWAVGTEYQLPGHFVLEGNIANNTLIRKDPTVTQARFNTPRYRTTLGISNRKLSQRAGFSLMWRYQTETQWESAFVLPLLSANIPAFHTLDAQVSYRLSSLGTAVKIGATNLLNRYYHQAFGNPSVGGLYYFSLLFDQNLISRK